MGDLKLAGPLNLMGTLTLKDKVFANNIEVLVEGNNLGTAPPVILPPPPAPPSDPAPQVSILASFNKSVKAGTNFIVAQGMVMQGIVPTPKWPGMMLPSQGNTSPSLVSANGLPVNVVGDQAVIFPSGGSASFNQSGQ
jgi:hypothetical protein